MNSRLIPTRIKRQFKDSGTLVLRNTSSIGSGEVYDFVLDERFIQYDDVTAINLNSDNDCTIFINGLGIQQPLPKGTSTPLNHSAIRTIRVKNNGSGSISINEIEIYYRHTSSEGESKISKASTIANIITGVRSIFGR